MEDGNWRDLAACVSVDAELWFIQRSDGDQEVRRQKRLAAKRICKACEVQVQCLDYARSTGQEYGIWGGHEMGNG